MDFFNLDKPNGKDTLASTSTPADDKNQKCQRCMKSFPTSQQLLQHSLVHSNLRKFPCRYCDKSFKQLSHVQQHLRIHTGERPYRCVIEGCTKAFRQLSSLQQHLKGHSFNSKNSPLYKEEYDQRKNKPASNGLFLPKPHDLICQICEKQCANDQRFFRHMHKYHPEYWRVFSGGLPLSNFLSSEATSSSKDNPFLCSICNKRYIHRTGYIKHLSSHVERQQTFCSSTVTCGVECQVCKKVFSKEAYLVRHLEMKTDSDHSAALGELKKTGFLKITQGMEKQAESPTWYDRQHSSLVMCLPADDGCKVTGRNNSFNQSSHLSKFGTDQFPASGETNTTSYLSFTSCLPSPTYFPTLTSPGASKALGPFAFNQDKYFASPKPVSLDDISVTKTQVRELQSYYQDSIFNPASLGTSSSSYNDMPYFHPSSLEYYSASSGFGSNKVDTRSFHTNLNATLHSQLSPVCSSDILDPYFSRTPQHDMASALQHLTRYASFR